jgi:hypothetical protein
MATVPCTGLVNDTLELAHHGVSQPTATQPPSKLLLYEHRPHHDASTGAGFARTAVSSAALFAIPLHVEK